MTSRKTNYLIVLILSSLILSCSSAAPLIEKNPPPVWVLSYAQGEDIQGFSGLTVGVGYSEPTFYEKDAWRLASKNEALENSTDGLLLKPYTGDQLLAIVSESLPKECSPRRKRSTSLDRVVGSITFS